MAGGCDIALSEIERKIRWKINKDIQNLSFHWI